MVGGDDFSLTQFSPGDGAVISTNIYDIEEIHHNCVVQVLRNSVTGEISIGWWPEGRFPAMEGGQDIE